jgi:triosephosphate isomerase (TIM)
MRRPFVCGNWKLHHGVAAARQQLQLLRDGLSSIGNVELSVAPTAIVLSSAVDAAAGAFGIAAQNVHFADKGAFTGEWSVAMLKEIGVRYAIVGHSERRAMYGDDDSSVGKKVRATLDGGLTPIACVGESLAEREGNKTSAVITSQVKAILDVLQPADVPTLVVAYEPVWAIGTGKTASAAQAQDVHALIRSLIRERFGAHADAVRIQYGGSVKPDNAAELMREKDVDGALVGGAALDAASLLAIARAAAETVFR